MRFVDLSHSYHTGMPQYPGQPTATFAHVATVESDGHAMTEIQSQSHVGTHGDAPSHFIQGGATSDGLPVNQWVGWAAVVSIGIPEDLVIRADDLPVLAADSVSGILLATGHSDAWGTPSYYGRSPNLAPEAAYAIASMGLRFVGLDFASPDPIGSPEEPSHHILLRAGTVIVENLTNLGLLTRRQVWFSGAPIRIRGGDGGFCRAYAIEEDGPQGDRRS